MKPALACGPRRWAALMLLAVSATFAQPVPPPDEATLQSALQAAEQQHGAQSPALLQPLLALQQLYLMTGRPAQAIASARRALQIAEAAAGPQDELVPRLTNNLGEVARESGQLADAIAVHTRSLALHERRYGLENPLVATSATNLALALQSAGRLDEARPLLERSLGIRERAEPRDEMDIANSLNSLGEFHRMAGSPARSADYYARSLAIIERQMGPEHWLTALLLGNLATARLQLGELDQALPAAERSLALREKLFPGPHPQTALGLNTLAEVYRALGQDTKTLPLLQRGLAMQEQALGPEHPEVAMALNNLGGWLADHGRLDEALPLEQRSLAIIEKLLGPDHPLVATSLGNMGAQLQEAGRVDEAVPLQQRSLAIRERRLGPDHLDTLIGLHNLAVAQAAAGDREGALSLLQRTVTSAHDNPAARDVRAAAQHHLSRLYAAAGQPDLAIVWGKESINTLQSLRAGVQGLDRGLQSSFVARRRDRYDHLADLLIAQGRIAEAQDVLQMLKEDELREDALRAEGRDPNASRIELTGLERSRFARYYTLRDEQAALAAERQALEQRARRGPLPAEDAARLKRIVDELQPVAQRAMQAFFGAVEREMAGVAATGTLAAGVEASRLRQVLDTLAQAEPQARAVGVQYLVTEQRLSVVLSLPGSPPIAYQQPISRRQLYDRIAIIGQQLKSPSADPKLLEPALRELHDWLIGPIEADLGRYGAGTLMLSLDDQLRLIPFAALRDAGGRYLVQRYTLSLYNEAARLSLDRPDGRRWRIAAMGLSEAVEDLQPLRAVPDEINAVVAGKRVSGEAFLNAAFDRRRLGTVLAAPAGQTPPPYNVLHVASHFVMQPGLPAQSRLYLGDKSRLTLADIGREDLRFANFELVTFSACETARGGGRDADGREMESLGAKAQNQGARAVLATLWQVADRSTGRFMQDFYAATTDGGLNKAAALRATQVAMIEGKLRPARDPSWSAPFYWAPFVLMGNWR